MRRYIYPLFITLLIIVLLVMGYYVKVQLDAVPAWDGTFTCEPGSTYTTAECNNQQ